MKKISKIIVSKSKLIPCDDLKFIRGGYDYGTTCVQCVGSMQQGLLGSFYTICPSGYYDALEQCQVNWPDTVYTIYTCGQNC